MFINETRSPKIKLVKLDQGSSLEQNKNLCDKKDCVLYAGKGLCKCQNFTSCRDKFRRAVLKDKICFIKENGWIKTVDGYYFMKFNYTVHGLNNVMKFYPSAWLDYKKRKGLR